MDGLRTMAERISRLGLMNSVPRRRRCDQRGGGWGASSGAIENQQLVLDPDGFGHHRTCAARTGEPEDGRRQMEKQDDQVAHAAIPTSSKNPRMLRN